MDTQPPAASPTRIIRPLPRRPASVTAAVLADYEAGPSRGSSDTLQSLPMNRAISAPYPAATVVGLGPRASLPPCSQAPVPRPPEHSGAQHRALPGYSFLQDAPLSMPPHCTSPLFTTPNGLFRYYFFAGADGLTQVAFLGSAADMLQIYRDLTG